MRVVWMGCLSDLESDRVEHYLLPLLQFYIRKWREGVIVMSHHHSLHFFLPVHIPATFEASVSHPYEGDGHSCLL